MLSRLHWECLGRLLGDRLRLQELDRHIPTGAGAIGQALGGYLDGLTPSVEDAILARLQQEDIGSVYLDGSNLGHLARSIRRRFQNVRVYTFFHNVEARFFLGALRQTRDLRAVGVLIANYSAERMAVRSSQRLITLSERDSRLLKRLYGRAGTDILPMALEDQCAFAPAPDGTDPSDADYALFVGGAFYANVDGIRWFAREVAPHIGLKTRVVGRGMEPYRADIERSGNVELIGAVDRLEPWYRAAKVVIAPIFDGSGMKTKIAEALMFGKRVVGTAEAFAGYGDVVGRAGWLCETAGEFIKAMRQVEALELPSFDRSLRRLYEESFSLEAAQLRLGAILGEEQP
ncbi:glycosyltransferase [Sphingosinicella sp. BN140058]|uniref:glycosyltransferase n=1 Tax=Sphingosinicella sp. BN140058 TaxID=1892855 RepID=UPI0013EA53A7|nr:glycosyltransferase [Sphingosinicella sp. BN140058]